MGKMSGAATTTTTTSAVALMVLGLMAAAEGWKPSLHEVGGDRQGWRPNVNYTNWTIHETFYVGDWLYFGFDKHVYNVLQVNKSSYDGCINRDFIKNVTRGGRDVFNLTEAKPFYFICGRGGHCFHGMKLAIETIRNTPPPTPRPSSSSVLYNTNAAAAPPLNFTSTEVAALLAFVVVPVAIVQVLDLLAVVRLLSILYP